MFKIGLTGGIGSGKSAVSDHFEHLGIDVIDADIVAREVVLPGSPALIQITARFGNNIIQESGELDRQLLREIIFSSPEEKQWLEALIHPIIRDQIVKQLDASNSAYSILVSPLLFETDQHQLVDRSLLVDTTEALQIERATERDKNSKAQIQAIIAAQMSRECKLKQADDIIPNLTSLDELKRNVERLHQKYLELSNEFKAI